MAQRPFELARTRVTLFEALLRARDDSRAASTRSSKITNASRLSYDDIVRAAFALGGKIDTLIKKRRDGRRVCCRPALAAP